MAISPVIVGSAAAFDLGSFRWEYALIALGIALLLQIGVNYANDYSDGVRGTDDKRVGPLRLTASGAASPGAVKAAAFVCFGLAMLLGLLLVVLTQTWPLLLVGVACVVAAWGYTGGKNPYGYLGLGDVFVFIFFGLVATLGTTYTQAGRLGTVAYIGAICCGLFAMALLMANNVRDIPTDRAVGKKTLAVRLGDSAARLAFVMMLGAAILLPLILVGTHPWVLLVLLLIPVCLIPAWVMLRASSPEALIPVLKQTGVASLLFAVLYSGGVVLTRVLS